MDAHPDDIYEHAMGQDGYDFSHQCAEHIDLVPDAWEYYKTKNSNKRKNAKRRLMRKAKKLGLIQGLVQIGVDDQTAREKGDFVDV